MDFRGVGEILSGQKNSRIGRTYGRFLKGDIEDAMSSYYDQKKRDSFLRKPGWFLYRVDEEAN